MPLIKVTTNKIWCDKISTDQTSHTSNGQDILRAWKCTKTSIGSLRTRIKHAKLVYKKLVTEDYWWFTLQAISVVTMEVLGHYASIAGTGTEYDESTDDKVLKMIVR